MLSGCRTSELLLLLMVMMTAAIQAQSGDEDPDIEPRISCTSHITTGPCTLTCNVVEDENESEDDEDRGDDGIKEMKACYTELSPEVICVGSDGDTISFSDLSPVVIPEVTFSFKSGRSVTKMIDLRKIVKPRSPHVRNVTFHREPYHAVVHVATPYRDGEYLRVENQLFQLQIWNSTNNTTENISSKATLRIDEAHLRKNTKYHVKVRAISQVFGQRTWSEWSQPYNFSTPAGEQNKMQIPRMWETYALIVGLILVLAVASVVILSWKNKIFTYMWPNIPHPKDTLVQICNPNTGLLLNVKPDVFSVLNVYAAEEMVDPDEESGPLDPAGADQSGPPCSSQSSDCSRSADSGSTEDLDLSALLSRSSSDEEESLQSAAPSPVDTPGTPQPQRDSGGTANVFGVRRQEEAYVTMSSFYQINKTG